MGFGNFKIKSPKKILVGLGLWMIGGSFCLGQVLDLNPLQEAPQNGPAPLAVPQPEAGVVAPRAKVVCPSPEELRKNYRPLSEIQVKLAPTEGTTPIDCSESLFAESVEGSNDSRMSRSWGEIEYQWEPTLLAHQPLYFDDVPLERYGQSSTPLLQPVLSGARFFGSLPVLPYKVGLNGPWERVSTLGTYRPGSPAPCVSQRLPLKFDAAFVESGAWVGLIFLLP